MLKSELSMLFHGQETSTENGRVEAITGCICSFIPSHHSLQTAMFLFLLLVLLLGPLGRTAIVPQHDGFSKDFLHRLSAKTAYPAPLARTSPSHDQCTVACTPLLTRSNSTSLTTLPPLPSSQRSSQTRWALTMVGDDGGFTIKHWVKVRLCEWLSSLIIIDGSCLMCTRVF